MAGVPDLASEHARTGQRTGLGDKCGAGDKRHAGHAGQLAGAVRRPYICAHAPSEHALFC